MKDKSKEIIKRNRKCPKCGGSNIVYEDYYGKLDYVSFECNCGYNWCDEEDEK